MAVLGVPGPPGNNCFTTTLQGHLLGRCRPRSIGFGTFRELWGGGGVIHFRSFRSLMGVWGMKSAS